MQRSQFHYDLPEELIAAYPTDERSASRLMLLDGDAGTVEHRRFTDVVDLVDSGDLLVLNDTRVIPARLYGRKATGGKVEILVERVLDATTFLAHVRASKSPKVGGEIHVAGGYCLGVGDREGDLFRLSLAKGSDVWRMLEKAGQVPLPPYIERDAEAGDIERYQTVYARHPGAVAAPTAGLHFDRQLLDALTAKGVRLGFTTLHVGAGTFQPVRVDDITEHQMHSEMLDVSSTLCDQVAQTKAGGGRVIAVGTTCVRCLETAGAEGILRPLRGDTDIFIYPGYKFQIVDALITNFHLPESTLLMLVSAFSGYNNVMAAYAQAVEARYRFFSYGDAMFVTRRRAPP